ncbi:MAG: hypothetical protein K2H23_03065 [Oscillospiraceae bacterium]|nr:hypothetical protein [Oscillospiraceae bacterium]
MKKILTVLVLICVTAFSGCSLKKEYDLCGKDKIESLRSEAGSWESGRYLLTNLDTGEMNQAFSFMNNEDGSQSYLYEVVNEGSYYAEYSGGDDMYILDGGEVYVIKEGGEGYAKYSESDPHPYSTGELLFYVNQFVSSSAENTGSDGAVTYTYYYNTDKINEALNTTLTEFYTAYTFDSEGNFVNFIQHNTAAESSYSYMIEIIDVNAITEIENPAVNN